jgi:hypothetical protein
MLIEYANAKLSGPRRSAPIYVDQVSAVSWQ